LTGPLPASDPENSEAILYKNMIIAEMGDPGRALEHLDTDGKDCLDRLAVMELRARYLLALGRKDAAAKAFAALLDRNSERPEYYQGLLQAKGISDDDEDGIKTVFAEYSQRSARCDAARRLPLDYLTGMVRTKCFALGK
jgi:N-alpha-acetyltransferase 15/16, NatA auxiliary subunit